MVATADTGRRLCDATTDSNVSREDEDEDPVLKKCVMGQSTEQARRKYLRYATHAVDIAAASYSLCEKSTAPKGRGEYS